MILMCVCLYYFCIALLCSFLCHLLSSDKYCRFGKHHIGTCLKLNFGYYFVIFIKKKNKYEIIHNLYYVRRYFLIVRIVSGLMYLSKKLFILHVYKLIIIRKLCI